MWQGFIAVINSQSKVYQKRQIEVPTQVVQSHEVCPHTQPMKRRTWIKFLWLCWMKQVLAPFHTGLRAEVVFLYVCLILKALNAFIAS